MATLRQAFEAILGHYRARRFDTARSLAHEVLRQAGEQADVLHVLANIELEDGHVPAALDAARRAVAAGPDDASFHLTLGRVLRLAGDLDGAVAAYRQALRLNDRLAGAHSNLCHALRLGGSLDEAVTHGRRAVELDPKLAPAHVNLAAALRGLGRPALAAHHLAIALELEPGNVSATTSLAHAQLDSGDIPAARENYLRALSLDPSSVPAHLGLGHLQSQLGEVDAALASFREARRLAPQDPHALLSLVNLVREQGDPSMVEFALASCRELLARDPEHDEAHRTLLFTLNYDVNASPVEVFEEHRRWGARYASLRDATPFEIVPRSGRPLRVGYVSADFRNHAVSHFLLPLLQRHDPRGCEIWCYSNVQRRDDVTERYRAAAAHWRDVMGLSDAELAATIRRDRLDILIDVSGHTAGNRLRALARKPAPRLVTYLGYPHTTGLAAFDYRLTDAIADPPGLETPHVERLVRLPRGVAVYRAPSDAGEAGPPPCDRNGCVTFGTLANPAKINPRVIALWCELLRRVPGSRLLIARQTVTGSFVNELLAAFTGRGVTMDRLVLHRTGQRGQRPIHSYREIDVALDTFPYSGHTTVCEALWMGVPTVTLAWKSYAGRMGASVLTQAGFPQWVARDEEEYLRIACDTDALVALRGELRQRVAASPLCDEAGFTREYERVLGDLAAGRG